MCSYVYCLTDILNGVTLLMDFYATLEKRVIYMLALAQAVIVQGPVQSFLATAVSGSSSAADVHFVPVHSANFSYPSSITVKSFVFYGMLIFVV